MWCFPLFINRLVSLIYSELGIRGWLHRAKTRCDIRVTFVLHSTGLWTAFERQMLHWGLSTGRTAAFEAFFAASVGFSLLVWVFYRPACTGGLFGRFSFTLIPQKTNAELFHIVIIWYICTKYKRLWQTLRLFGYTSFGRRRITSLGAFRPSTTCLQRSKLA